MIIYLIKKILIFLLVLLLLSLMSFSLLYFLSGTDYSQMPLQDAYFYFLKQLFSGQFNLHSQSELSFFTTLKHILPTTIELCLFAILLAMIIGIPLGILVGLHNKSNIFTIQLISLLIYASPLVWIAILTLFILSPETSLVFNHSDLPISGPPPLIDILLSPDSDKVAALIDELKYSIIPIIILSLQPCIITIQLISQRVAYVIQQNYMKVAFIRENSPWRTILRHLLPNTLPEVIPQLSYNITTLLFSTMAIEIIFNRIGLGSWTLNAYYEKNYAILAIAILCCGALISILILLSEIVATLIYPIRLREQYK